MSIRFWWRRPIWRFIVTFLALKFGTMMLGAPPAQAEWWFPRGMQDIFWWIWR